MNLKADVQVIEEFRAWFLRDYERDNNRSISEEASNLMNWVPSYATATENGIRLMVYLGGGTFEIQKRTRVEINLNTEPQDISGSGAG